MHATPTRPKREVFAEMRERLRPLAEQQVADVQKKYGPDDSAAPGWTARRLWKQLDEDERDELRAFCPWDLEANPTWNPDVYAIDALTRLARRIIDPIEQPLRDARRAQLGRELYGEIVDSIPENEWDEFVENFCTGTKREREMVVAARQQPA